MNNENEIMKNKKPQTDNCGQFEAGVIPPLNTIENIDCMEMLRKCPNKHFDLAIVDPPYGIGMDGGNVGYKGFNDFEKKDWDASPPPPEYFEQLFRVSKNQIIWGGNYFNLPATRCYVVWDKGEGFYNRTYAECELAWTSFNRNTFKIKHDPLANGDYKGKLHPTQKPLILYKRILKKFAAAGDLILDTHVGSGSSIVACIEGGFNYYGCEIDKDYYDAAQKRIARAFRHYELNFNNESAV